MWEAGVAMSGVLMAVCAPITSSASCDEAVFVDQAADVSMSSDTVLIEVDRFG